MSRLNEVEGVSKFHWQFKKKQKTAQQILVFHHCLEIKFNQQSRLQSCLQNRSCKESYQFHKTKVHMKNVSQAQNAAAGQLG